MYALVDKKMIVKPWGRAVTENTLSLSERSGLIPSANRIGEVQFDPVDRDVLVKFLLTSECLSVQVHPDDVRACELGRRRGKDECWLVLEALPEATLGIGLKQPISEQDLRSACEDGSIVELMHWHPARAGDFVFMPAGTIHALGPGLIILEVQQNSDLTFRLFDFDRGRPLQIDEAISAAWKSFHSDYQVAPNVRTIDFDRSQVIYDGPKFGLALWRGERPDLPRWVTEFQIVTWNAPLKLPAGRELPPASSAYATAHDLRDVPAGAEFFLVWATPRAH